MDRFATFVILFQDEKKVSILEVINAIEELGDVMVAEASWDEV